jgi:hypothetical protein
MASNNPVLLCQYVGTVTLQSRDDTGWDTHIIRLGDVVETKIDARDAMKNMNERGPPTTQTAPLKKRVALLDRIEQSEEMKKLNREKTDDTTRGITAGDKKMLNKLKELPKPRIVDLIQSLRDGNKASALWIVKENQKTADELRSMLRDDETDAATEIRNELLSIYGEVSN